MAEDETINRVEFWRNLSEGPHKSENTIWNCIDGKILNDETLKEMDLEKPELDAIKKGYRPDKYYTALENMLRTMKTIGEAAA